MKTAKPLIFISNDDGVQAKGIEALIEMLRTIGELVIVAPDGGRSGSSSAITSLKPLQLTQLSQEENITIYACNGTPVDCVKLGLQQAVTRQPDLVVSGINHGDNASVNVHYSGTMGVVIEGTIKGIPSIGFSLADYQPDADFSPLTEAIQAITKHVLDQGLPPYSCLNVNFPKGDEFKGIKICRMAKGDWRNEWEQVMHPENNEYYWLAGAYHCSEPQATDTDNWALTNGYIAITPTQVDVTDYTLLDQLKQITL